mmetsp:Transcript_23533/g.47022  ORF Transcript_23533/g.47022 Transcript_23533/m.47022 type:complete len:133 (-) Transcript_23533:326-724(-)
MLTFTVDALEGVPVYAHPSLRAPIISHRRVGQRLRGFAPVHFWVCLMMGEGWVRLSTEAGSGRSSLTVLGRPPLGADYVSASRGFARYKLLPSDADYSQATATLSGGFYTISMPRHVPNSGRATPDTEDKST